MNAYCRRVKAMAKALAIPAQEIHQEYRLQRLKVLTARVEQRQEPLSAWDALAKARVTCVIKHMNLQDLSGQELKARLNHTVSEGA